MSNKDEYGYTCACGKKHHYPPYVIAHIVDELVHTCKCGRKNIILDLTATIGELPKAEPYDTVERDPLPTDKYLDRDDYIRLGLPLKWLDEPRAISAERSE